MAERQSGRCLLLLPGATVERPAIARVDALISAAARRLDLELVRLTPAAVTADDAAALATLIACPWCIVLLEADDPAAAYLLGLRHAVRPLATAVLQPATDRPAFTADLVTTLFIEPALAQGGRRAGRRFRRQIDRCLRGWLTAGDDALCDSPLFHALPQYPGPRLPDGRRPIDDRPADLGAALETAVDTAAIETLVDDHGGVGGLGLSDLLLVCDALADRGDWSALERLLSHCSDGQRQDHRLQLRGCLVDWRRGRTAAARDRLATLIAGGIDPVAALRLRLQLNHEAWLTGAEPASSADQLAAAWADARTIFDHDPEATDAGATAVMLAAIITAGGGDPAMADPALRGAVGHALGWRAARGVADDLLAADRLRLAVVAGDPVAAGDQVARLTTAQRTACAAEARQLRAAWAASGRPVLWMDGLIASLDPAGQTGGPLSLSANKERNVNNPAQPEDQPAAAPAAAAAGDGGSPTGPGVLPDRAVRAKYYLEADHNLANQWSWYDSKASRAKRWTTRLGMLTLIAGAATSVLQLWAPGAPGPAGALTLHWSTMATALLGAVVIIAKGVERIWKFDESWVAYRQAAEGIKREQRLYINRVGDYAREEDEAYRHFVENVEAVIATEQNTFWQKSEQQGPAPAAAAPVAASQS